MAKYISMIMVNAKEGQEDELNAWLNDHHLPEVLRTEGYRSLQRYVLAPGEETNPKATHKYIHFFEIETDDLEKTKAALNAGRPTRTPTSPALDTSTVSALFFKALGEKLTK